MSNPNGFPEIDLDVLVSPPDDFGIDLDVMVGGDPGVLLSQELTAHYSTCPFCGGEVDLSEVDLFEPRIYPYCPCFKNSNEWQKRMITFPVYDFALWRTRKTVKFTCPIGTNQAIITLILMPVPESEKVEIEPGAKIWRRPWSIHLVINPTFVSAGSELEIIDDFWPPTPQMVDLIIKLRDLNERRIGKLIQLLENSRIDSNSKTVRNLREQIDSLDGLIMDVLHGEDWFF